MNEHVTQWLNAYLDGELHGLRLRQVEAHLDECAACRSELAELRRLSRLLKETPPAGTFTTTERFVANLNLRLGAQQGHSTLQPRPATSLHLKASDLAWWLVPVAVLGAWIFIQTVLAVSNLVSVANEAGLLGQAAAWLRGGPQHTDWFLATMSLFGSNLGPSGQATIGWLDRADLFGQDIFVQLVWQAAIALLYWAWLAIWWTRRRKSTDDSIPNGMSHI